MRDSTASASPLWPLLQGADLSARVLTAQQIDAMTEIIDACRGQVPALVLLKGISICVEHYPEPHLRPMRDIDVLIEDDAVSTVEAILSTLGYRPSSRRPSGHYEGHHHGCPLMHPSTGVWIDVHRRLFSPRLGVDSGPVVGPASVWGHLRPSYFFGRPVRRLSTELEMVHLASHWADGLRASGGAAPLGGMVAMVDMILLLKHRSVDWRRIFDWTYGSRITRHLDVLLSYLAARHLVDISPDLFRSRGHPHTLAPLIRTVAHTLIERYVVDGRRFGPIITARHFNRIWKATVLQRSLPSTPPSRNLDVWREPRGPDARPRDMRTITDSPGTPPQDRQEVTTTMAREDPSPNGTRPPRLAEADGPLPSPLVYPKRRGNLHGRIVDGEMVVLDRRRHLVHQFNATARYIWERCDGAHSLTDIAVALAETFDVDVQTVTAHVKEAVDRLEAAGLVEPQPEVMSANS